MAKTQHLWGERLSGCAHTSWTNARSIEPRCSPQVKNGTGIYRANSSCCPLSSLWHCRFSKWDSSWWITTTSCSGTGLVTLAICICIVSESEGRGCPRHLGTFAISWRSLAMLLVAHRGSGSSPCASRTGLLCLSASINIHLLSEASWFYLFFFFRSFCVT